MAKKVAYFLSWTDLDGRYKRKFDTAQERNARYNQLIADNKQMKPDDEFFAANIRIWQKNNDSAMDMDVLREALSSQGNQQIKNEKRKRS